jgi:flagellum-specific ATP synthase
MTAFYSVLVEGDDTNEPISDAVRGLLDGHVVLSRKIASRGHYPAIDVLGSISRLMPVVTAPDHAQAVLAVRRVMAAYRDHEDLISVGAYRPGTNPLVDTAITVHDDLNRYLRQEVTQGTTLESASAELRKLAARCIAASAAQPRETGAGGTSAG